MNIAHEAGDPKAVTGLQAASAHWLRHEMITAIVDHAGLKITTGGYLHTLPAERHAAMTSLMK